MNEIPTPDEDTDEIDERYRRLSERDASSPSEAVRRAVLRHAAELAAHIRTAAPSATTLRPAAKGNRWRVATYSGLAAAAVLTGLLLVPHFLMPGQVALQSRVTQVTASPQPAVPAPAPAPPPAERAADAQPVPGPARNSIDSPVHRLLKLKPRPPPRQRPEHSRRKSRPSRTRQRHCVTPRVVGICPCSGGCSRSSSMWTHAMRMGAPPSCSLWSEVIRRR